MDRILDKQRAVGIICCIVDLNNDNGRRTGCRDRRVRRARRLETLWSLSAGRAIEPYLHQAPCVPGRCTKALDSLVSKR